MYNGRMKDYVNWFSSGLNTPLVLECGTLGV